MECRVKLKNGVATVFYVRDNQLIPVQKKTPFVKQEYETDGLLPHQQEVYKDILHSEKGALLINKLKNVRLSEMNLKERMREITPIPDKFFENPFVKLLCEPRTYRKVRRKVIHSIDEAVFNRLTFKDLGITKLDVLNVFRAHQLINF